MNRVGEHPIDLAEKYGYRYKKDLEKTLSNLTTKIDSKKFEKIIDRLVNSKRIHSVEEYIQAGCEIIILDYIIRNYYDFEYEPTYNRKKNPECSFVYENTTVNLEVKCPNYEKRKKQESNTGINIHVYDRMPDFESVKSDINMILETCEKSINFLDRMDNKLSDYLISANGKFPKSDESNFNVLIIGLEILDDFDEWYNYLFSRTGIFNSDEIIKEEKYEDVDAIMFTNCRAGLINLEKFKNINIWKLENSFNIMFLIPSKCNTKTGTFYSDYGIDIFGGHSRSFFRYINDPKNDVEINQKSPSEEQAKYINVISDYIDYLKSNKDNDYDKLKL